MKWVDDFDKLIESTMTLVVILPWLALIPLFFITPRPPRKPVGNNCCTHWENCVEQAHCVIPSTGPYEKGDKKASPPE